MEKTDSCRHMEQPVPLKRGFSVKSQRRASAVRLLILTYFVAFVSPLGFAAGSGKTYAGVLGGLATLSGDARTIIGPANAATALYSPNNGLALDFFAGRDLSNYVSLQFDYMWNRNSLTVTAASFAPGTLTEFQEARSSAQSSVVGDVLFYFRNLRSRIRPYLSVGGGVLHFSSTLRDIELATGSPILPPNEFAATTAALRVPVGLDVRLGHRWWFRYTFSETISHNPISEQLTPAGPHTLKNFQNLFGLIRKF